MRSACGGLLWYGFDCGLIGLKCVVWLGLGRFGLNWTSVSIALHLGSVQMAVFVWAVLVCIELGLGCRPLDIWLG